MAQKFIVDKFSSRRTASSQKAAPTAAHFAIAKVLNNRAAAIEAQIYDIKASIRAGV